MRILIAPDSFKESMTAKEAADAIEIGIRKVMPDAVCVKVPMADGGEGTTQSLVDATNGQLFQIEVLGPLGDPVTASFGLFGDGKTAVLEMASASGMQLIPHDQRNPLFTTTYGTGQLIKAALDKGAKHLVIGIGGSATNDGGAGMFQALGGRLLDKDGYELPYGGGSLDRLHTIDASNLDPRLKDVTVEVACDVNNPLTGENGASHVFGPQKGATPEMVERLDSNLKHYAKIIKEQLGKDVDQIPGAGAAGGLGAGLIAFLSAKLIKGVELVIQHTKLEQQMAGVDFIITGEGRIDGQTVFGKTIFGISTLAQKHNLPVIALVGCIGKGAEAMYEHGVTAMFSILSVSCTVETALQMGRENLIKTSENIARVLKLGVR